MNSARRCFVIMPIGQEGTDEHAHFRSVFDVIIKPAVVQAGYEVRRADESSFTGSITREIVETIASSDLVIADLTDRNPNVYLELGIRHCLKRSGTIHLIRDDQVLPFDVSGYRAIKYSTDFDKIDGVRTAIVSAIREKERAPEVPDNPVHDTLELPQDYRAAAESEQVRELEAAQRGLAEATREIEALRRRYQGSDATAMTGDVSPVFLDERDIAAKLTSIANVIREDALPGQLIVRAHQAAADGDLLEVVALTQKILLSPFATAREYRTLARISNQAGMDELKLLVLEQAAARFPGDADCLVAFAEACIHTPDPEFQARGQRLLEGYLGVEWTEDGPVFTQGKVTDKDGRVGVLLDYYHGNDRFSEELELALAAQEVYGETPIILRNVARAYEDLGDEDKAGEYYGMAVEADPTSDTSLAWFGNFHARRGEWDAAKKLHVRACQADPDDAQRVTQLLTVCMAEGQARGGLRTPEFVELFRDLAALAIARANGGVGVRAQCAERLHTAGSGDAARKCLDENWPSEADVVSAEARLVSLAQESSAA